MPLYEYQCENCGELFEVMQKFSDEPLTTHVKCGGKVHRLLSAPALQFKGSGWYITDYAKGSGSGNGSGKSGEDSSSGKSGEKSGTTSSASTSSGDKPSGSSSGKKSE
ncbi:MAG TPA: FmdB family zinc ribbon protein [Bryobacteraceae bacterium]|jgi:putative FmdB family regulatory protein|nr:FmdB family zinc ribbon protein [Bryobacteraceae bacterium]